MYAWLRGPGAVFRDPLPSSTNYLSAYDKEGNLLRSRQSELSQSTRILADPELSQPEADLITRDRDSGASEEEIAKRSSRRQRLREEKEELEKRGGVPREKERDLKPYPLNREFRSQPVLSQELREKIWELVVEGGNDIVGVSAAFGVDVRRVAAVVRLGSVEREWREKVSPIHSSFLLVL